MTADRKRLIILMYLTTALTAIATWATWKWSLYWHPTGGVVFSLRDGALHAFIWDPAYWTIRYKPGLELVGGEQGVQLLPSVRGAWGWGSIIQGRQRGVDLPWWFIAAIAWTSAFILRKGRAVARRRRGACPRCGYPLIGVAGPCPECGNTPPARSG